MTQEEKELLLKDLCARLPYEIKCQIDFDNENVAYLGIERYRDDIIVSVCIETEEIGLYEESAFLYPGDIKPYLRPMSSMTEEERQELSSLVNDDKLLTGDPGKTVCLHCGVVIDFHNSHYLDWRGLIPMGLALEAPEGMYD